jgi:hypothetical protein
MTVSPRPLREDELAHRSLGLEETAVHMGKDF